MYHDYFTKICRSQAVYFSDMKDARLFQDKQVARRGTYYFEGKSFL